METNKKGAGGYDNYSGNGNGRRTGVKASPNGSLAFLKEDLADDILMTET